MKTKCVEMVRKIRDRMAEQCGDMSSAEVVAFIHSKAKCSKLWKKIHKPDSKN